MKTQEQIKSTKEQGLKNTIQQGQFKTFQEQNQFKSRWEKKPWFRILCLVLVLTFISEQSTWASSRRSKGMTTMDVVLGAGFLAGSGIRGADVLTGVRNYAISYGVPKALNKRIGEIGAFGVAGALMGGFQAGGGGFDLSGFQNKNSFLSINWQPILQTGFKWATVSAIQDYGYKHNWDNKFAGTTYLASRLGGALFESSWSKLFKSGWGLQKAETFSSNGTPESPLKTEKRPIWLPNINDEIPIYYTRNSWNDWIRTSIEVIKPFDFKGTFLPILQDGIGYLTQKSLGSKKLALEYSLANIFSSRNLAENLLATRSFTGAITKAFTSGIAQGINSVIVQELSYEFGPYIGGALALGVSSRLAGTNFKNDLNQVAKNFFGVGLANDATFGAEMIDFSRRTRGLANSSGEIKKDFWNAFANRYFSILHSQTITNLGILEKKMFTNISNRIKSTPTTPPPPILGGESLYKGKEIRLSTEDNKGGTPQLLGSLIGAGAGYYLLARNTTDKIDRNAIVGFSAFAGFVTGDIIAKKSAKEKERIAQDKEKLKNCRPIVLISPKELPEGKELHTTIRGIGGHKKIIECFNAADGNLADINFKELPLDYPVIIIPPVKVESQKPPKEVIPRIAKKKIEIPKEVKDKYSYTVYREDLKTGLGYTEKDLKKVEALFPTPKKSTFLSSRLTNTSLRIVGGALVGYLLGCNKDKYTRTAYILGGSATALALDKDASIKTRYRILGALVGSGIDYLYARNNITDKGDRHKSVLVGGLAGFVTGDIIAKKSAKPEEVKLTTKPVTKPPQKYHPMLIGGVVPEVVPLIPTTRIIPQEEVKEIIVFPPKEIAPPETKGPPPLVQIEENIEIKNSLLPLLPLPPPEDENIEAPKVPEVALDPKPLEVKLSTLRERANAFAGEVQSEIQKLPQDKKNELIEKIKKHTSLSSEEIWNRLKDGTWGPITQRAAEALKRNVPEEFNLFKPRTSKPPEIIKPSPVIEGQKEGEVIKNPKPTTVGPIELKPPAEPRPSPIVEKAKEEVAKWEKLIEGAKKRLKYSIEGTDKTNSDKRFNAANRYLVEITGFRKELNKARAYLEDIDKKLTNVEVVPRGKSPEGSQLEKDYQKAVERVRLCKKNIEYLKVKKGGGRLGFFATISHIREYNEAEERYSKAVDVRDKLSEKLREESELKVPPKEPDKPDHEVTRRIGNLSAINTNRQISTYTSSSQDHDSELARIKNRLAVKGNLIQPNKLLVNDEQLVDRKILPTNNLHDPHNYYGLTNKGEIANLKTRTVYLPNTPVKITNPDGTKTILTPKDGKIIPRTIPKFDAKKGAYSDKKTPDKATEFKIIPPATVTPAHGTVSKGPKNKKPANTTNPTTKDPLPFDSTDWLMYGSP